MEYPKRNIKRSSLILAVLYVYSNYIKHGSRNTLNKILNNIYWPNNDRCNKVPPLFICIYAIYIFDIIVFGMNIYTFFVRYLLEDFDITYTKHDNLTICIIFQYVWQKVRIANKFWSSW
jgi:hypothetical protein